MKNLCYSLKALGCVLVPVPPPLVNIIPIQINKSLNVVPGRSCGKIMELLPSKARAVAFEIMGRKAVRLPGPLKSGPNVCIKLGKPIQRLTIIVKIGRGKRSAANEAITLWMELILLAQPLDLETNSRYVIYSDP